MPFIEAPRFPDAISMDLVGGPTFLTEVVELESGHEVANSIWSVPRMRFSLALTPMEEAARDAAIAFVRAVAKGKANRFRVKDWNDYSTTHSTGRLGTGAVGTGLPTYQAIKRYTSGAYTADRDLKKLVASTSTVKRGGSDVTAGAGAGNIAIDTTTGVITFVADASSAVAALTPGVTTSVTLGGALAPLAVGEKLYLSGITGTVAASLNGLAHPITNIAGAVYTLSTDTDGLAYTSGGTGYAYPQAGETLTIACEFDVPVRLDVDDMRLRAITRNPSGLVTDWQSIELIEVRV
jgi:uncharacterized protein (TIGR02217 family)